MPAPRILQYVAGRAKAALAIATSAGAGDADKVIATNASGKVDNTFLNATNTSAGAGDAAKVPLLDPTGRISSTMMPVGIGADTVSVTASEALAAGDLVNIYNNAGTPNARKADATTEGKEAHGFVLAAVSASASATIYLEGQNTQRTGMTPGARQYLSTSPGGLTETPPSSAGNVVMCVGTAINATTLNFEPQDPITLA